MTSYINDSIGIASFLGQISDVFKNMLQVYCIKMNNQDLGGFGLKGFIIQLEHIKGTNKQDGYPETCLLQNVQLVQNVYGV